MINVFGNEFFEKDDITASTSQATAAGNTNLLSLDAHVRIRNSWIYFVSWTGYFYNFVTWQESKCTNKRGRTFLLISVNNSKIFDAFWFNNSSVAHCYKETLWLWHFCNRNCKTKSAMNAPTKRRGRSEARPTLFPLVSIYDLLIW